MTLRNLPANRPSVTFNFKRSKKLDPRVTFTRASFAQSGTPIPPESGTGTVGGELLTFNTDVPRLTDQGLLMEESRTNYIQNSIDFNAGDWSFGSNGTSPGIPVCTPNSGTAPDGTNTATRLVCDHGGGTTITDVCQLRCNRDSNSRQVVSIWVKSNTGSDQTIYMTLGTGGSVIVTNTWKRYLGLSSDYRIGARGDRSDQNVDVLIWGAQVEDGDNSTGFHTSYIPTSGAEVTRAADIFQITGNDFSSWYNTEGTFAVNCDILAAQTLNARILRGNNQWATPMYNSNGGIGMFGSSGVGIALDSSTGFKKFASSYGGTRDAITFDGNTPAVRDAVGTFADTQSSGSRLLTAIGSALAPLGNTNGPLNLYYYRISFYPTRVSDPALQALTI